MSRNIKRLLFALISSSMCYGGFEYWYRAGLHNQHSNNGKAAIAKLNESNNEVQRKEAKRVIWESISRNDELFPGEAIRTTSKAEAKIVLLKSGTVIHLEPDSLVVLEDNGNGLSLDFLQGNLFVQSTGKDANTSGAGVTLKSGQSEIKLQSADMSLSKDQSGQVNLEVFKGQAELAQNGKTLSLAKDRAAVLSDKGMAESKDRLQLLTPQAGETLLLNLVRGEKLDLSWKPLSADYRVSVEIGATRAGLKKVGDLAAGGEAGQLSVAQKPGNWFLRLTAQSSDVKKPQLVSMVVPFTIEPKAPPSLVEPTAAAPVIRSSPEQEVQFHWLNRNKMETQILEVAKDAAFKSVVVKKDGFTGDIDTWKSKLEDGTYFWRVTGYLNVKGKLEGVSSTAEKIQILSNIEIKAATLTTPANHSHIAYTDAQKTGITMKWQAPIGAKGYKVVVERKEKDGAAPVLERELDATTVKLTDVKPGSYSWKITTVDPKGGAGKTSEAFHFDIDDIPKLEWAQAEPAVEYIFSTPTPTLEAHWKTLPAAAAYRYRVSPIEIAIEETVWQTTKQDRFNITLKEEGKYLGVVEGLNAKGQTIAQSDVKTFVVKRRPLLPAPLWTEHTPEVLKTDGKGNLSFDWKQVEGAQQYLMILENADGQAVEQREVSRTTASVTRLKPGQYKVKLKSVDMYKRPSPESEARKLEVPNTSDIKAPKIKAMKVK